MNYDRKQLKLTAKEAVRSTVPKAWVVTLIYVLLAGVAVQVVNAVTPNPFAQFSAAISASPETFADNPELMWRVWSRIGGGTVALSIFVSVLVSLYQTVMRYGYVGYCLKVWRREETAYGNIFSGFSIAGRAIGASIMVGIFTFLWCIPLMIGYMGLILLAVALADASMALGILGIIAALVFLIVGVLCISYRYCLTAYYQMNEPEMGVFEAITASKRSMRGNIRRRLVLDLSFLGWELLLGCIVWLVVFVGLMLVLAGNTAALSAGIDPAAIWATAGIPGVLVLALSWLASLPLSLWLNAYMGVANAGFFLFVKEGGQREWERPQPYGGAYSYLGSAPPIPPGPTMAEEPQIPPAPEVPDATETPEAPEATEAPEVPQVPETPQAPQEPGEALPQEPQEEAPKGEEPHDAV